MPLNAELWSQLPAGGLAVALVLAHLTAYMRGWLVPGRYHREIVQAGKDALDKADERAAKDAEAIRILSGSIAEKNATDDATTRILAALRETIGRST